MAEIAAIISDSLFDDKEDLKKGKDDEGTPVVSEDSWVSEFLSTFDKVTSRNGLRDHGLSDYPFRLLDGRPENRPRMKSTCYH